MWPWEPQRPGQGLTVQLISGFCHHRATFMYTRLRRRSAPQWDSIWEENHQSGFCPNSKNKMTYFYSQYSSEIHSITTHLSYDWHLGSNKSFCHCKAMTNGPEIPVPEWPGRPRPLLRLPGLGDYSAHRGTCFLSCSFFSYWSSSVPGEWFSESLNL